MPCLDRTGFSVDLAQPVPRGVIGWSHVEGDLFALCAGVVAGQRNPQEITLLKNVGGGHVDLLTARCLAERPGAAAP